MGGLIMRLKRRRSVRRKPVERFMRATKELLAGCGVLSGITLLAGVLRQDAPLYVLLSVLLLALSVTPLGMFAVMKEVLAAMGEKGRLRVTIGRMQKIARVSVLYLGDVKELTDGQYGVGEIGAPFFQEDERAMRRKSAWMFLCTASALCSEEETAAYARSFGYDGQKLRGQFPPIRQLREENDVLLSEHQDGGQTLAFLSGPLTGVLDRCQLVWEDAPRPFMEAEREALNGFAARAMQRGMRVTGYGMSQPESFAFLGYIALEPLLKNGAKDRVKALLASGVRATLLGELDAGARAIAKKTGVSVQSGRFKPSGVYLRTAGSLGEVPAEGIEVTFPPQAGLEGVLEDIQTARHRLCTLVEAARSAGKAAALLGVLIFASFLSRFSLLWLFLPVVVIVYTFIALYYKRRA